MAARQFVGTVGGDDEERQRRGGAGEEAEEIEARRIGPMEVVEQEDERVSDGECREEVERLLEEHCLARYFPNCAAPCKCFRDRGQASSYLVAPEQLYPRTVGRCLGQVVAAPDKDRCALLGRG